MTKMNGVKYKKIYYLMKEGDYIVEVKSKRVLVKFIVHDRSEDKIV